MSRFAALRCHRAWAASKTMHFSMSPGNKSASSPIRPAKTPAPASAIQFLKLQFSRDQITRFKITSVQIVAGFDHYAHMAALPELMRAALSEDFD